MSVQTAIAYSFEEGESSIDEDEVDDDGVDRSVFRGPLVSKHRHPSMLGQAPNSPLRFVQVSASSTSVNPTVEVVISNQTKVRVLSNIRPSSPP